MKLKRRIISLGIIIVMLINVSVPLFAFNESKVVKIGFYSLPGFQNVESDGTLSGYMYDYLQEISKTTNWTYEYEIASFQECLDKLENGEIDFVSGIQETTERSNKYLFPQYDCGSMYIGLYVNKENENYAYGDTQNFNNLKVGIIKGMELKNDFNTYCENNGLNIQNLYEYETNEELNKALETGEINAICALSTYGTSQLRCIASFGYKDFYLVGAKGNESLVNELDKALANIKIQNPNYEQDLWNRYITTAKTTTPVFTKEELAYIKNCKVMNVVYNKNWIPMESYNEESDSFDGIDAEIFALIGSMSGLDFNFIAEDSYANALKMLEDDEVNMISSTAYDYTWAKKNNIKLSNEYLSVPIVIVSKGTMNANNATIAMPKGLYLTEKIKNDMPNYKYKEYLNYSQCLEAVANGEADASIMNSYMASEYLKDSHYSSYSATALYGYTYHFCIGFSSNVDNILISIIDKTLACISEDQITEIVVKQTVKYSSISAIDLIYQNPIESIGVILIIFGLLIVLLFIILFNKSKYAKKLYDIIRLDPLTKKDSLYQFKENVSKTLNTKNEKQAYALIYLNILRFKDINDIYGYSIGDKVLITISDVLNDILTTNEYFTRLHSDRFLLFLNFENKQKLEERYAFILSSISTAIRNSIFNESIKCKSSVFIYQNVNLDISDVINNVGYAYENGNDVNGLYYYDETLQQKIRDGRMLEAHMQDALKNDEFKVYYQPKVNSNTNEIVGAEALIRWQHQEKGLIPPQDFIPLFEKNGFVIQIDLFVFQKVCSFLEKRKKEGKTLFPISCNFSRLHFIHENFYKRLITIVDQYDIDRSLIEIELTETMAMENLELVKIQLEKIHNAGFRISIDDFGSGYSSLGILSEILFDVVKLDRSLIINVEKSKFDKLILTGLVDTIHSLNKKIICEGVETKSQVELLKVIGCENI